jgi:hypothetical protein
MATLQATNVATSIAVAGNVVWHGGNDGTGSALNVNTIWGYGVEYLDINSRLTNLDLTGTSGSTNYNLTTFYPLTFDSGASWGSGVGALHIRRTNVHQEGGGFGSLFGRIRYRSSQWGHHGNFWEMTENWGNGSYYPFIANMGQTGQNTTSAIFLRGGLSYWYRFDHPNSYSDTSSTSPKAFNESNGAATISTTTTVNMPSNSRYWQHNICVKSGYNFGDPNFRWSTVFAVAENNSSDGRKKENFKAVLGTAFLKLLKPKSFQRIGDTDRRRSHGFIAQEVQEAMHQLGLTDDDFGGFDHAGDKMLALRYTQFLPVLIKTLQEKRERVKTLTLKIEQLEARA